ncbi:PaaI family thioesterase [Erythrobacter sp. GH1-10]|uniref:PaaI family thioesterase n=1 Tax=Erythrobacter sp. GH1-10 TaxID=3349334 RepID=UPI0038779E26
MSDDTGRSHNPADAMPFSKHLGVRISKATAEEVFGELDVREELCTTGGIAHGGAIMAFADSIGAIGAFITLPEGAKGTTTIESKTNFLGPARAGSKLIGVSKPVKVGARVSVWLTEISTEDGRKVAMVSQTQMVL